MASGLEWPSFPKSLLEAPAEAWGRLPCETLGDASCEVGAGVSNDDGEDAASSARLLADVEKAFGTAREEEDLGKALETMRTFLAIRRVRLLEDLVLLSASLGNRGGSETRTNNVQRSTTARETNNDHGYDGDIGCDDLSAAMVTLRQQLASANEDLQYLPPVAGVSGSRVAVAAGSCEARSLPKQQTSSPAAVPVEVQPGGGARPRRALFAMTGREGGGGDDVEEGLRHSAGVSTEAFFGTWAERFRALVVPLGREVDKEGDGRGDGGGEGARSLGKDDREIQAARDIERDTLLVNGVSVKGSEGYSAVVGRVKRELGLLAEPVAGADRPPTFPATSPVAVSAVAATPEALEIREAPLRPYRQLENFSKLVLKAANRTESGGLSFDAIHRIMSLCPSANDGSILVVPDSSKAEPLGVAISARGFTQAGETPFGSPEALGVRELTKGVHAFGICANVEAVTVYSLYSADMEQVHLRLRATFRSSLRLPLSPVSYASCEAFGDVGYRGENGEVELEVLEGPHKSRH